jgi:uncharacterized FlgJ-related protein
MNLAVQMTYESFESIRESNRSRGTEVTVRMSVKEFAKYRKTTERTVYRWIMAGLVNWEQLAPNYPYEIIVLVRQ